MAQTTSISWTDKSWNPVTGCSHVSPGCEHCYAEALSLRFGRSKHPWGAQWAAENVVLHPERLDQPLKWRKPQKVFVNSMSDLFHEQIPVAFIAEVFARMAWAPSQTFQILTKRAERMQKIISDPGFTSWVNGIMAQRAVREGWCACELDEWPLTNVWLGVSVEDQRRADERIPILVECPAVVRFLSCEPLLGPVSLKSWMAAEIPDPLDGTPEEQWGDSPIDWVIVGGESGPHFRPMDARWAAAIRDQCLAAGVAFWFKQGSHLRPQAIPTLYGETYHQFPEVARA